jgi:hypothetical protein
MRQTNLVILLIAASAFLAAQTDPPDRVGRLKYISGPRIQPAVGARPQGGAHRVNPASPLGGEPQPQGPNAQQRSDAVLPPVLNDRQNESPLNPAGTQNGRWSASVAGPGSPPSNANPREQNAPWPNAAQQTNAPPPDNRSSEPPPRRRQPEQLDRTAPSEQPTGRQHKIRNGSRLNK